MSKKPITIAIFSFLFLFYSCSSSKNSTVQTTPANTNLTDLKYTVEEAPQWTALLKRTSGWFGADGIFAIPMNGKENASISDDSKNLILFSDSMVGEVEDGKPKKGAKMVHNTVAILKGDEPENSNITFYWDSTADGKPETIFIPHTPSATPQDYYWLGDGFYNTANNTTYIFAYRMRNLDAKDDWSFHLMETVLIALPEGSTPPFKNQRQIETPFTTKSHNGSLGAGIFVNTKEAATPNPDGYIYVYGTNGKNKGLTVARVKPEEFENFSEWRYWDGTNWNTDIEKSATVTDGTSNELSVSPLPDGRYILVFQLNGMSNIVGMRIGASPVGPFGPVQTLYKSPEGAENKKLITYNAKAHPSLSEPGELLITYNVNAYDFWQELQKDPQLYRPRFLKLKFQ